MSASGAGTVPEINAILPSSYYKLAIRLCMVVSSLLQNVVGVAVSYQVVSYETTGGYTIYFFALNLYLNGLLIKYGEISKDPVLVWTNGIRTAMNAVFIVIFLVYSINPWTEVYLPLFTTFLTAFSVCCLIHGEPSCRCKKKRRYTSAIVLLYLFYTCEPLSFLPKMMEKRSSAPISWPASVLDASLSFFSILYFRLRKDSGMQVTFALVLIASLMKIILCVLY